MALYLYIKKQPESVIFRKSGEAIIGVKFQFRKMIVSRVFSTLFSGVFVILGLSMISFAGLPMLNWQLNYYKNAPEEKIVRPIPMNLITTGANVNSSSSEALAKEQKNDLSNPDNWFTGLTPRKTPTNVKEYTLSIPKLGIFNAQVKVGSEELNKSLVHYGGTAIPGEYGNAAVFGHSCLPQFYNPKNYSCIFATLDTLSAGDEILINVDKVEYKYIVYDFKTVLPEDISVLEQRYDNYYLSLITCVPPGLALKRLVVKAKLEKI